jgi:Zn-dependent oligopeptidase
MYSLVFAADMYATVFKKDPLNPALGERYKNSILLPGGSREELDSLTVRCGATALLLEACHMIGAKRVNLQCRSSSVAHRTRKHS